MSDDTPPINPPDIWRNPEDPAGPIFYFGNARECPTGTIRGKKSEYAAWWKRHVDGLVQRRKAQIAIAEANLEAERAAREAAVAAPELERLCEPSPGPALAAPVAPVELHDGAPSPYTPGARVRLWAPGQKTTMRDRPNQQTEGPTYETILLDNREESESIRLLIHRVSPDPGLVEELDLLEHLSDLDTTGKVMGYIKSKHFDGRPAIFKIALNIDTESEGPWRITIPKDPLRMAEMEADREAAMAQIRARRGLPPLPPPAPAGLYGSPYAGALGAPAAPAPLATPAGYVGEAQVADMINAAVNKALAAVAPPPAPAAPPAPVPPPPAYFTREEAEAMISKAVREATAPAAPAAPAEPPKSPLEQIQTAAKDAAETVASINEANNKIKTSMGITEAAPAAPDVEPEPVYNHNGMAIPREMLKKNPNMAFGAMNFMVVQGLLDGIKNGVKEVIREGPVVGSGDWSPPRGRQPRSLPPHANPRRDPRETAARP